VEGVGPGCACCGVGIEDNLRETTVMKPVWPVVKSLSDLRIM
jgi:hypothetical protein